MSTTLKTIFGTYESPTDGILPKDVGGIGHSTRRQFSLVSTEGVIGSVDIQGAQPDVVKERVTGLLERAGFRRIDNRQPA